MEKRTENSNGAAKDLWAQLFSRASQLSDAAMHNPDAQTDLDRVTKLTQGLLEAGWSEEAIAKKIEESNRHALMQNVNSPGVGPGLEAVLRRLSDRIALEVPVLYGPAVQNLEVAIDPKIGVSASLINVIMTEEAILTVSSFLFRYCGLIARAYTRTLIIDAIYWSHSPASQEADKLLLLQHPELVIYWMQILISFAGTGTHVFVPYKPCSPREVILMEQVAWSMEYFTVAHEYGHHILRHREISKNPIQQEFDADEFSLRICGQLDLEPFEFENPYLRTGAGATILLKSLDLLNSINWPQSNQRSTTHPSADERIQKILSRNVMQPDQLAMDLDFNNTALRILQTIQDLLTEYLDAGGDKVLQKLKSTL